MTTTNRPAMAAAQQGLPARILKSPVMAPVAIIGLTVGCHLVLLWLRHLDPPLHVILVVGGVFDPAMLRQPGNYWFWPQFWAMFASHGFLHIGLLHLAVNMVPLAVVGRVAALRIGGWRFILLYFATMVAAAVIYGLWPGGTLPMVGASGAVHGVWGAVIVWAWQDREGAARWLWALAWLGAAVALNGWFWWLRGFGFAWQLHVAGLALGAMAAPFIATKKAAR